MNFETLRFFIAQALGVLVMVVSISIPLFKKMWAVLLLECLANFLIAVQYLILGGDTGGYACAIAVVHTLILYLATRLEMKKGDILRKASSAFFIVVYVTIAAFTYESAVDIVPGISTIFFAVSVMQEDVSMYRFLTLSCNAMWMVYDIANGAYTNLFTRGLLIASTVLAIVKFYKKRKNN